MVELGIPELTTEQIELLCSNAETAAKKYIISKVSSKEIERLDISVEADGMKPVDVTVEINLLLVPQAKSVDIQQIVKEAVIEAHSSTEKFLRKIK